VPLLFDIVMAKRGSRKGKKGARKGAPRPESDNGPVNKIVPWNQNMRMTDSYQLPALTESIFKVIQSYNVQNWLTADSVSNQISTYSATLAQFSDNLSALTSLFDQYRIDGLEVWIKPTNGPAGGVVSEVDLFTVLDYDGGTISNAAQANGYSTCIQSEFSDTQRRAFKPRIAYAAYSGAFTSYANQQAGWIDCGSTGVLHYGLIALATPYTSVSGVANPPQWDLQVRAHISFRSTH
jgi:hypothetical protein